MKTPRMRRFSPLRSGLRALSRSRGALDLVAGPSVLAALSFHPLPAVADGFPELIELSSLDGADGFALAGIEAEEQSGWAVSGAGDVNADGIDDLIIGARRSSPDGREAGASYVVFGTAARFPAHMDLSTLDGSNGFALWGASPSDNLGFSVSRAGDVNGDGIDDVIVGAYDAAPGGHAHAGASYVVFGSAAAFPATLSVSMLDGRNGFALNGVDRSDESGWSVSDAGDVNGDGIDDLLVGAPFAERQGGLTVGKVYVVFGRADGFSAALSLSELDGSNGFQVEGIHEGDRAGTSAGAAGDINADGIDDLVIGAYQADANGQTNAGESYVVFGSREPFPPALPLSTLDGNNGFALKGNKSFDESGNSVSGAGDVNADGIDDLFIGAHWADYGGDYSGAAYIVFGRNAGFPAELELSSLNGFNGFVLKGFEDLGSVGESVSAAGDVNGDGLDDVIVGAYGAGYFRDYVAEGASYVVFGSDKPFPAALELSALNGSNGFAMKGIDDHDQLGWSVDGSGDVNGDGIHDVIAGAPKAAPDNRFYAGESYVVFGRTADADEDSVPDSADNCQQVFNADQRDTDGDGIGNLCDGDFDQDCLQHFADLEIMKENFFVMGDIDTDMNGDGTTNFLDLVRLRAGFLQPPGPSGLPNLCDDD